MRRIFLVHQKALVVDHPQIVMMDFQLCDFFFCLFVCLPTVEKAPGPSLFDQKAPVSGFEQQQQQPVKVVYYRAVYPFDARSHDEISIAPGDVIMVCCIHTDLIALRSSLPDIQPVTKTHTVFSGL